MSRHTLKSALTAFLVGVADCPGATIRCVLRNLAEHLQGLRLTKTETAMLILAAGLLAAGLAVPPDSTALYDSLMGTEGPQAVVLLPNSAILADMGAMELSPYPYVSH